VPAEEQDLKHEGAKASSSRAAGAAWWKGIKPGSVRRDWGSWRTVAGFADGCVESNPVIDGHQRIEALQQLRRDTVEAVVWSLSDERYRHRSSTMVTI